MRKVFSFRVLMILFLCLSLCQSAFADVLRLPEGIKVIEREAFYGNTNLDEVVLPVNPFMASKNHMKEEKATS